MSQVQTSTMQAQANRFSISYQMGDTGPRLKRTEFATIADAAAYATSIAAPLHMLSVTEWDNSQTDGYGVPEYIGSCSLEEAFEGGYDSLDF